MNKVKLLPKQKQFVYSTARTTAYCAGRSSGKTFAMAFLISSKLTTGISVLAVAPTYPLLNAVLIKDTLEMLRRYGWKYNYNKTDKLLILSNRDGSELSRCYFRSADCYDTIRGISNVAVLVMDEAAYCAQEAYDVCLACLRGENIRNPQAYLVSTPKGFSNWFSQVFMAETTESIKGSSLDNTYIDEGFVEMLKERYSDSFAEQEIYAEILDSTSAGVFKANDVTLLKEMKYEKTGETVFGFDIAGSGDDLSSIAVKVGNKLVEISMKKTDDDNSLVEFVSFMIDKYKPVKINIDSTGIGNLLPSRLAPLFPNIQMCGVNFGAASSRDGFSNARSDMYFMLRDAIRKEGLHFSGIDKKVQDIIEAEMFATEYSIDNRTNFQLKSKKDIKKELKRSPDALDSLALACYTTGCASNDAIKKALNTANTSKKFHNRRG